MLQRAYSTLEVRAVDDERRVFTGVASTPSVDRQGDVVLPEGAEFEREISLLLHHDAKSPVGIARLKRTKDAILFEASIPHVTEAGRLRDRVDEAWQSLKHRLIRGVSIGFRALDDGIEVLKTGGLLFKATEILELSLVSVPANQDALISTIKSFDAQALAAHHGIAPTASVKHAHRPGTSAVRLLPSRQEQSMKTLQEQISAFENTRAAKRARLEEIQKKAGDEGRSKDEAEREEFDTLKSDIAGIDQELKDLRDLETMQKSAAVVVQGANPQAAAASRGGAVIRVSDPDMPKGLGFARFAIAGIMARKTGTTVAEFAKSRWPSHEALHSYIAKAAVPAGTTTNADWMGNLVDPTNLVGEFMEYLRPLTLLGRIQGLRRVPFNVRITGQTTGAVANWTGQGRGKPVTSFATNAQTLLYTKITAIAVITEELARFSSPSAEMLVRDELSRAVIERMDVDFVDPGHAAVANVNPASITNGVVALSSAGASEANIRTDITSLLAQFIENNVDVSGLVLVMPNTLAMAASVMVNSLGQPSFPGIGINGGTLLGIPVVASQYAGNQSGYGNLVIALNARDIAVADDGGVTLDSSREASIEMTDAPTGRADTPTAGTTSLVSMYQTNSIAIRAERYINWAKLRSNAVVYIDDANWGSVGSPS